MVKYTRTFTVFVSSPGDMKLERDVIAEVCEEISRDVGYIRGFRVEAIRWEFHTTSDMADRSQEVINRQTDDYDIYVGVMGFYFGSRTGAYGSGTEEEFERAFNAASKTGHPKIQFYFSSAKVNPDEINVGELEKVKAFRRRLGEDGIYYKKFEDLTQLKLAVRQGLFRHVFELMDHEKNKPSNTGKAPITSYERLKPYEALKNLQQLFATEPQASARYLQLEATKSLDDFTTSLKEIAERVSKLTQAFQRAVRETNQFNTGNSKNVNKLVKSVERVFELIEDFVYWISFEISRMETDYMTGMSSFQRASQIVIASQVEQEEIRSARHMLDILKTNLSHLSSAVDYSGNEMVKIEIPGFRWQGNKKLYAAICSDFVDFLERAVSTIDEIGLNLDDSEGSN